jgi:GR25 family glycosyltransferase involved in LPS biosynthesis
MDFSKLYNYEDIKFENKHVKILNGKQEVIFEDDIEFPINFEDNAAAIVASKHRETSDIEYRYQIEDILMELYKKSGILNSDKFELL